RNGPGDERQVIERASMPDAAGGRPASRLTAAPRTTLEYPTAIALVRPIAAVMVSGGGSAMFSRSSAVSRFRGITGFTRLARAGIAAAAFLALTGVGGTPTAAAPSKPGTNASGWPEITSEEKALANVAEDPEADAVVLLKSRDSRIAPQADDFINVMKYGWRMKI